MMTEQEQRIAIAEFCGWKHCTIYRDENQVDGYSPEGVWSKVPNYLHDLNAMREALRKLDNFQRVRFWIIIWDMTTVEHETCAKFQTLILGAEKWAEALLKTIGKWKE